MGRDVKAVLGRGAALTKAGVVERQDRFVVFPFDGVHVDFVLGQGGLN